VTDVSRRRFISLTAAGTMASAAAGFGPFFQFPERSLAGRKTLRIARWAHFMPEYNDWFDGGYAEEWGRQHDTHVVVDRVASEEIHARAAAEVAAGTGHDLFMFPWPPAEYQRHVIDHSEIYKAVASRHGIVNRIGHASTFDPVRKRYFAFADSWIPAPFHYFHDDWAEVGMPLGPVHYDGLRSGARRVRATRRVPCGLAIAPSLESNVTLHTLLYAFNSGILDRDGDVVINRGARTIAALEYVKALYQDAGTAQQLTWGPLGNVRAMLARETSCTVNGISLLRAAEAAKPDVARNMLFSPPLVGTAGIMAVPHVTSCSVVWSFAQNKEGASQFLVDLIDNFSTVYQKSKGCNLPTYQTTVPDLIVRLSKDPAAEPASKYVALKDALHWTVNLGFPGFANPAAMETFNTYVVPRMFTRVVKGELSPENAAQAAESEVKRLVDKWKET